MKDYFKKNYSKLRLPICSDEEIGLRNAQIGAIHAIASFFTLKKNSAAIVVMPTGSGKTAVLQMAPYFLHSQKVLIVTPSVMVRSQIVEDFKLLCTLKAAGVFAEGVPCPNVYEMENLYDFSMDKELGKSDVIVASAQCALSLSESKWSQEHIDLVEVDEAHHTPAKTWMQILKNLDESKHVLVTATPFRLDKRDIKGELIYTYSLAQAYEDGIFGTLQFVPVTSGSARDLSVAKKAEEIFNKDKSDGLKHYLMVRTDTKKDSERLIELYQKKTSLRLEKVDSSMTSKQVKSCIQKLKNGEIDGIICVDMLGEGFDFPNLKIAAIHKPQKSLAATLQFIGRFARTNADDVGSAKFIAVNDENFQLENRKIFARDSVWQDMIINLYDHRNKVERRRKQFISDLQSDVVSSDIIPFSLDSIALNCHVKIYKTDNFVFNADFPDECFVGNRVFRSDNTVIGIAVQCTTPLWLDNGQKINLEYGLFVLHFQKQERLLYIYSHVHSETMYEMLVNSFSPPIAPNSSATPIPRDEMNRVLCDMENFEIFNSGMVNRFGDSGEAYRIMAGSNVSNAINESTGQMYSAGHVFCRAEKKGSKEKLTIGYSSASKVWSSAYMKLADYIEWCEDIGKKINNTKAVVKTHTNLDYLPSPQPFPLYPSDIFYADFSYKTYMQPVNVYNIESEAIVGSILDFQIKVDGVPGLQSPSRKLHIELGCDNCFEKIEVDCFGRYVCEDCSLYVIELNEKKTIAEYLNDSPLRFYMFDDSMIEGAHLYKSDNKKRVFDKSVIETRDWDAMGVDIKDEVNSIQPGLQAILKNDKNNALVFFDHGSGEIADFITMQNKRNKYLISLYHVKGASSDSTRNSSLGDVYEVAGQAVKSMKWFSSKANLINRVNARFDKGHFKSVKGKKDDFVKNILRADMRIRVEIYIVQPSLSPNGDMDDGVSNVLEAANEYIKKSGYAKMKIIGRT